MRRTYLLFISLGRRLISLRTSQIGLIKRYSTSTNHKRNDGRAEQKFSKKKVTFQLNLCYLPRGQLLLRKPAAAVCKACTI